MRGMLHSLLQITKIILFIIVLPWVLAIFITDYLYWDLAQGIVLWMSLLLIALLLMLKLKR
jgi:hypothetical protein